jgi:hypothetical protein
MVRSGRVIGVAYSGRVTMRSVVALYLNREVREKEDATTTGGVSAICG